MAALGRRPAPRGRAFIVLPYGHFDVDPNKRGAGFAAVGLVLLTLASIAVGMTMATLSTALYQFLEGYLCGYSFLITDLVGDATEIEHWHRQRARVEERIKDAKYGAALRHLPMRDQHANWAWMTGARAGGRARCRRPPAPLSPPGTARS